MTFIQQISSATHLRPANQSVPLDTALLVQSLVAEASFSNLRAEYEAGTKAFWCRMAPPERPSFTTALLRELHQVQHLIATAGATNTGGRGRAVNWVVLASVVPGVFSLGGDLDYFRAAIQTGDADGLRRYAHDCVEVSYRNSSGYGADAISIGLAQGDALGGGFESLLSCDVIVAEKRARFGLPEINFNLFPGMGAHSFLTRRVGAARAQRMVLDGDVYSADAMFDAGIVDLVVPDGEGEAAVRDYMARNSARFAAHSAAHRARRRVSGVSLQELRDVTDIWVDAAMALSEQDLHRMGRIIAAQDKSRRIRAAKPQG